MPGRVPEHVIQQIVRSADIVRLVGRYTQLKKRGKRFWGLCPFHKEKTPSFSVSPEEGLYYCFGCHQGGNVFTFLKEVEGLEFYEALQQLAREAGVDLTQYESGRGPSRQEMDGLRQVNELAATFYEKCLRKARGSERARDYLTQRQINDQSVERWRIGYAPEGWEHFMELAARRGIAPDVLEAAGLAVPRSGADGHYDRFRNRLMFPVRDRNSRVIGFGARALAEDDEVKYINSPEGPAFSKGRCFYGFCEARETIRQDKTAVIVEGYTDVIMAHQCGVEGVMAVLGTALTEHHARALSSLCESVILVFDADEAGQKSATRSIEVLLGEDLEARVASLEPGEDPCDFLLAHGPDAFRERLTNSEPFLEFRLRRAREQHDVSTLDGRARAFDELAELALTVRNEAKRDMLIRTVASELGISERSAFAYVERTWSEGANPYEGEDSPAPDARLRADEALPGELLGLLLENPGLQRRACKELDPATLRECPERELVRRLLEHCRDAGPAQAGEFIHSLDDEQLISRAASADAREQKRTEAITSSDAERRYEEYRDYLKNEESKRKKDGLLRITQTAQDPSEDERLRSYQQLRIQEDKKAARINPRKEDP